MLSKKQFNAATRRLQESLTASDLFQMLRHQLTKANKDNQHTEIIAQLGDLSEELKDRFPLDRRRAENYLAKSLYGKNHSQIAHLMKGSHLVDDEEFGGRAEMFGKFIKSYGNSASFDDDLVDDHAKVLAKQLRATSPECFNVSYQGYSIEADRFEHLYQYNVLMYVSFLDLDVQVEFIFHRDESPEGVEPLEESFISVTVNGMDLEAYGKEIGCNYLDNYNSSLYALETLFSSIAYEMVTRDDSFVADFYCSDFPEKLLKKHQWKLNTDRKYIAERIIKQKLVFAIESSVTDKSKNNYCEDIKDSIKGIFDRHYGDSTYDDISLKLKGFPHKTNADSGIISGEIVFTFPNRDTIVSISFSYDNEYQRKEIIQLEVKLNGEFIESCSDEEKLNSTKYPWWYVALNLRKAIPYINSLVKEDYPVTS